MSYPDHLPGHVVSVLRRQAIAQYGTVSAAGVPIDTPMMLFPDADLGLLNVSTGLAYPAKAERARRNPKVGLLIEGGPGEPVVSIAGMAAVRDANLQANLERYMAETILVAGDPAVVDYETVTRHAVWYFARIIISIVPVHIRWWADRDAMEHEAHEWRASSGSVFPQSDPAPAGEASKPSPWTQPDPQELARTAIARGVPGYLTLLDADGFPLPIGARDITLDGDEFVLTVPKGSPWSRGQATLCFEGREIFVGEAQVENGKARFRIKRALPIFPLVDDHSEMLLPKPRTKAELMSRLEQEAARRGQSIPAAPPSPPAPTAGARIRAGLDTAEA